MKTVSALPLQPLRLDNYVAQLQTAMLHRSVQPALFKPDPLGLERFEQYMSRQTLQG